MAKRDPNSPEGQMLAFLRQYEKQRIAELRGVHLFSDRVFRTPKYGNGVIRPECVWLAGVSARVEAGGKTQFGALHYSGPGGFAGSDGFAKPMELWLVLDGPTFQWQVPLKPRHEKRARFFVEALNSAARRIPTPPPVS